MKVRSELNWLVPIIIILTLVSAGFGFFFRAGDGPYNFTSLHGKTILIAGQGVYAHDSMFTASLSWGTDLVMLIIGIPLLLVSTLFYRKNSLKGGLILTGVLAFFLYYAASLGLGTAYNFLFLIYIALFSACFFAFILVFTSFDVAILSANLSNKFPHRTMAAFILVVGFGLAFIWLSDIVAGLIANQPPKGLGPYTTIITYTLDIGIISVACILSGVMLYKRNPMGFFLANTLNIMLIQIAVMVIGQTILQTIAGIVLTPGEVIGKVASFVLMGLFAIWLTMLSMRNL